MSLIWYPLSLVYGGLAALDRRFAKARTLPKPVVSVGNITWGGTGKTPVVMKLARELASGGCAPAILTRGYRRRQGQGTPVIVSDGKSILASPETAGDEPYLLAEAVPGAAVIVGSDRYAAALLALEKCAPGVFILDDGFQHWRLRRNLDIICINALNPFGNGRLIPAGILREPLSAVARAQLVLVTNADAVSDGERQALSKTIASYASAPVVFMRYRAAALRRLADGRPFPVAGFAGRKVAALSALAENAGFRRSLELSGMAVDEHITFRDHHWYDLNDVTSILSRCRAPVPVVTTAKDAVKLSRLMGNLDPRDAERWYVLETELECTGGGEWWEQCVEKTRRSLSTATGR